MVDTNYGIDEIQICKKINDLKLLMSTNKDIIFVDIINNSDYKIDKKIALIKQLFYLFIFVYSFIAFSSASCGVLAGIHFNLFQPY